MPSMLQISTCVNCAGLHDTEVCSAQGKHGHQAWVDRRQLMMPVFSGVTLDGPSRMLRVDSKVCGLAQHKQSLEHI